MSASPNSLCGRLWLAVLGAVVFAPALAAAGTAVVTYRKVFKSSSPEFTEIIVREDGSASYDIRQLTDDPSPQSFTVGQPLVQEIFSLAAQLHHFQNVDLELHRRIANLGRKTFHYEGGGATGETSFNYTTNHFAARLLDIFEGLANQQEHFDTLNRTMKYDRLGVNKELILLQHDLDEKRIPEPALLLPLLDQISDDDRFLDIARQRARQLADRIRSGK